MENKSKKEQLSVFAEGIEGILAEKEGTSSRIDQRAESDDIPHLEAGIAHLCANRTLKLVAMEKAQERQRKAPMDIDENGESAEQVEVTDSLRKKNIMKRKQDEAALELREQQGKLNALAKDIEESRGRLQQNEPRDETRSTELHKRNVALANILTLLTSAAGPHVDSGKQQEISELVNSVLTKNYGNSQPRADVPE